VTICEDVRLKANSPSVAVEELLNRDVGRGAAAVDEGDPLTGGDVVENELLSGARQLVPAVNWSV
jgi:hypothetical protein